MAKSDDLKASGHLIEDPNDATRSILRIDVSILNTLIDDYSAIELAAMGRGWVNNGVAADAVDYLIQWPKTTATEDVLSKLEKGVGEQAVDQFRQQVLGLF